MSTRTQTPRERHRTQIRAEVKDHAREQIAGVLAVVIGPPERNVASVSAID